MTTNSNGKASVTLSDYTAGTYKITISEEDAPDGYEKLSGTMQFKVVINKVNGDYVVSGYETTSNPWGASITFNKSTGALSIGIVAVDPTDIDYGSYSINLSKFDKQATSSMLANATFDVYVNGTIVASPTTNSSGTFDTPITVKVTSAGTDTIKIIETKAPTNYDKLEGTLILKVTKAADKKAGEYRAYIAKSMTITQNFTNATATVSLTTGFKGTIAVKVPNERTKITISGHVWEDEPSGKESQINGIKDSTESFLSGIKVTLHTKDGSNILYTNSSTMVTTTDSNGYFEFKVPAGYYYYLEYTYNGQNYQHTTYTSYSSSSTSITSNATETESTRDSLNAALKTIIPNMTVSGTTINSSINQKGPSYITDSCYTISAYSGAYGKDKIEYYSTTVTNLGFGITKREIADIAIRKDVYKATLSINGYSQDYMYNKRDVLELDANGNSYWDINVRQSDAYYDEQYERKVYYADYYYEGTNKLSGEVTYKITIRNQASKLNTKVTEIVDYYDSDYTYVEAYVLNGSTKTNLTAKSNSSYTHTTTISNYQKLYFDVSNYTLKPGEDLDIYVVFKVNVDTTGKILLDNDAGKGNMVETTGYETYYASNAVSPNNGSSITYTEYNPGDVTGRIDVDSNPGNAKSMDESTFEDDTDRAPYIKFTLSSTERTVDGTVWEDARTETVGNATIGNGIKDDGESLIGGVTVELWDKDTGKIAQVWNGSGFVDATTTSDASTGYSISGFVPGNYYLKFTYLDGKTYKSTTYNYTQVNKDFNVNNPDALGTLTETTTNYSDARDLWGDTSTERTRQYVNSQPTNGSIAMQAVTGVINVGVEHDSSDTSSSSSRTYIIGNIDFGLQEIPKAQLLINKEITYVKVVLADGSTQFDTSGKATNVTWFGSASHEYSYNNNLLQMPIVNRDNRQVLLTMDEEIMHGANMTIDYKITVKNIGEVDYPSKNFYYLGQKLSSDEAVTTTVNSIVDYAGANGGSDENIYNNLNYSASENSGWTFTSAGDIDGLVADEIKSEIAKYTTILTYTFNKELKPELENADNSYVETTLRLSQVITPDSDTDNQLYSNMVEILSYNDAEGRKLAYSTVGNQNPSSEIAEVDAHISQLTILPPFGQTYVYVGIGIGVAVILIAGIVIIKKKVLAK